MNSNKYLLHQKSENAVLGWRKPRLSILSYSITEVGSGKMKQRTHEQNKNVGS